MLNIPSGTSIHPWVCIGPDVSVMVSGLLGLAAAKLRKPAQILRLCSALFKLNCYHFQRSRADDVLLYIRCSR